MSSGLASGLEIAAKIIRENTGNPDKQVSLIFERLQEIEKQLEGQKNSYLVKLFIGLSAALVGIGEVAAVEAAAEGKEPPKAAEKITPIMPKGYIA